MSYIVVAYTHSMCPVVHARDTQCVAQCLGMFTLSMKTHPMSNTLCVWTLQHTLNTVCVMIKRNTMCVATSCYMLATMLSVQKVCSGV